MARKITYSQAINEALAQEMARDDSVIVMGEDNAGGAGAPGDGSGPVPTQPPAPPLPIGAAPPPARA